MAPIKPRAPADAWDWPALFALRDRLAWRWHQRHGRIEPVTEYHSAGNVGLAEAWAQWDPQQGKSWWHYAYAHMAWRMQDVLRGRLHRVATRLVRVHYVDPERFGALPHPATPLAIVEAQHDLDRLLCHVPLRDAALLRRYACEGRTLAALAHDLGVTEVRISQRLTRIRQALHCLVTNEVQEEEPA